MSSLEDAIRHAMRDATLKRLAWAFGCARVGSEESEVLRSILVEHVSRMLADEGGSRDD